MSWLTLILVGAAISGNVLGDEHEALKTEVLAKGVVLQTYSLYLQRMLIKEKNEQNEDVVTGYEFQPPKNKEELVAAIYERFASFRLQINYFGCRIFYKSPSGAAKPEAGDYEGCAQYSSYLYWYNQQFSAEKFYNSFVLTEGLQTADVQLLHVVKHMETLFKLQVEMYTALDMAKNEDYKNVFGILQARSQNTLTDEDAAEITQAEGVPTGQAEDHFRQTTLTRLFKFYGEPLMQVENYWIMFFASVVEEKLVELPEHLLEQPAVEEERFRAHYKVMEESNFEPTKLNFEEVHEIQYNEILFHGMEMRVKNVPEARPELPWEVRTAKPGSMIDLTFSFLPEIAQPGQTSTAGPSSSAGTSGGTGPAPMLL